MQVPQIPFFCIISTDKYSQFCQASKIENAVKIASGYKPLTIFAKRFILDIRQGSGYASEVEFELVDFDRNLTLTLPIRKIFHSHPVSIYLFEVNYGTTRAMCKICSTLAINTPNNITDVVLVPLLLTLNRFHALFWCFHCWHWTSKCRLGIC